MRTELSASPQLGIDDSQATARKPQMTETDAHMSAQSGAGSSVPSQ